MSIDDRRDDIHAMIGPQGLLRRVHDDSLEPTTRPPEVIVTTSGDPPAPEPGDPAGYDAYQAACAEIAHVWRHGMTAIGARVLPPYVAEGRTPSPHEADQATRALLPWLDQLAAMRTGERSGGRGSQRRGGILLAIRRAHDKLRAVAGHTRAQPERAMCASRCGRPAYDLHRGAPRCWPCIESWRRDGRYLEAASYTADPVR